MQSLEDLEQLCLKDDPPYVPVWDDVNDDGGSRNLQKYGRTIEQAMRYGLSNRYDECVMSNYSLFKIIEFLLFRAISNVMNALLGDLGFTDPTDIITKDKVRRLKIAHGYALQVEHEELGGYEFIGFDGMFNFVIF